MSKSATQSNKVKLTDETTVGIVDMARILELSNERVRVLALEGILSKAGHDRYLLLQSTRSYIRYLRGLAHKKSAGPEDDQGKTWEHWRALRMKAAAETMQIDLEHKRGKFVTAREVELAWADVFATLRAQLLSWASRLSPRTFAAGSIREHREVIAQEVDLLLRDLSGGEVAIHAATGNEPEAS